MKEIGFTYSLYHTPKLFFSYLERNSKNNTQMEILEQCGCFLAAGIRIGIIYSGIVQSQYCTQPLSVQF